MGVVGVRSLSRTIESVSCSSRPDLSGTTPRYPVVHGSSSVAPPPSVHMANADSRWICRMRQGTDDLSDKQTDSNRDMVFGPDEQSVSIPIPVRGSDPAPFPDLQLLSVCNNLVSWCLALYNHCAY